MTEERYSTNTFGLCRRPTQGSPETVFIILLGPFLSWPEAVFKKWVTCHSKLGGTAHNMIGPVLNGLKGRKSGSVATTTPAETASATIASAHLAHARWRFAENIPKL
jgi:hypothetical protein